MPPFVIAEAGQTMEGSVERAVEMVDLAADAGAWAFKVQLLDPETIATPGAAKYWVDDLGTRNQREAFTRAGLISYDGWGPVVERCAFRGIQFIGTPFDLRAVDALRGYGCGFVKIASGDITYLPLLRAAAGSGMAAIVSTGAAAWPEINEALLTLAHHGCSNVTLLACTLSYPTSLEDASIRRVTALAHYAIETARRLGIYVGAGYSDHTTLSSFTASCAVAAGALMLEKHFTYSHDGDNVPDHAMALDPEELSDYCMSASLAWEALGSGTFELLPSERAAHVGARRSAWLARDVTPGEVIGWDDVLFLRPGSGTPPSMADVFVGQPAARAARAYEPLGAAF